MLLDNRGQGLLEYVLIIGAILVASGVVIAMVNAVSNQYGKDTGKINALP